MKNLILFLLLASSAIAQTNVQKNSSGPLSEALTFNFAVIKSMAN